MVPLEIACEPNADIEGMRILSYFIIAWYNTGLIKVWDRCSHKFKTRFELLEPISVSRTLHMDPVTDDRPITTVSACWPVTNIHFACGYCDGTVCIWDPVTGTLSQEDIIPIKKIQLPEDGEHATCFLTMGRYFIIGCSNGNIRIYDSSGLRGTRFGNKKNIPLYMYSIADSANCFRVINSDLTVWTWCVDELVPRSQHDLLQEWLIERREA